MVTIENCGMPSVHNTGQFGWVYNAPNNCGHGGLANLRAKALFCMAPWCNFWLTQLTVTQQTWWVRVPLG